VPVFYGLDKVFMFVCAVDPTDKALLSVFVEKAGEKVNLTASENDSTITVASAKAARMG
jgi:hypothetical protein